jgi:hypothetical protein
MKIALTATFICAAVGLAGCGVHDYDRATYDRMERALLQSTNMMAGMSLADASKLLSLEGVPWDEGYCNMPESQARIYHFRGFSLDLTLEVLPAGITPRSKQEYSFTAQELRTNGVWWVSTSWPHLVIDRLDNPRTRMSNYWDNVHASFRRRSAEVKTIEARMDQSTNK